MSVSISQTFQVTNLDVKKCLLSVQVTAFVLLRECCFWLQYLPRCLAFNFTILSKTFIQVIERWTLVVNWHSFCGLHTFVHEGVYEIRIVTMFACVTFLFVLLHFMFVC